MGLRGHVSGSRGQFANLVHEYGFVGVPHVEDRFGWRVDALAPPDLDWASGDPEDGGIVTPFVGPELTVVGASVDGVATPWQLRDHTPVTCREFPAGTHLISTEAFDAGATDDMVLLVLFRRRFTAGQSTIVSTRDAAAQGWELGHTTGDISIYTEDVATTEIETDGSVNHVEGWYLMGVTWDRDGDQSIYVCGLLDSNDSIAALGSVAAGTGIAINATTDGAQDGWCQIARVMVWYGHGAAAIATDAWHEAVMHSALGIAPAQGADGDFHKISAGTYVDAFDQWRFAGDNLPRTGIDGIRLAAVGTNLAQRNFNPQAGDAALVLTWTGADAPTTVDDAAALAAAGAQAWGPRAYEYANTTGAPQHVRMSQATANTTNKSLQCLIRRTAGVGAVSLGLYDESAGTFVAGAAIHDGYDARTLVHGQIPVDTDCTLCLEVADATTIRWVAHDMETAPWNVYPLPNRSTIGGASLRALDEVVCSDTPPDAGGGVALTVTPVGWSADEPNGASILWTVWGAQATLHVTAAGFWRLELDGTTLITSTEGPVDGVAQDIRIFWSEDSLMSLSVDGVIETADYDGTIRWAGAWQLVAQQAEWLVSSFHTLRNGSG